MILHFNRHKNQVLRGDRPEHRLERLETGAKAPPVIWEQVNSETGQGGATGAFSKEEGEEL